jgi:hypothetical protein
MCLASICACPSSPSISHRNLFRRKWLRLLSRLHGQRAQEVPLKISMQYEPTSVTLSVGYTIWLLLQVLELSVLASADCSNILLAWLGNSFLGGCLHSR